MPDFKLQNKPIVIDPYDEIVQKAVNDIKAKGGLKGVEVIKLETTCKPNVAGYVSNQDLLKGHPGKQKVIHLCLKKLKDDYKKMHGSNFSIMDPKYKDKMSETIKVILEDKILPHEYEHIKQEIKGEGDFGVNPEMGAQRAESDKRIKQLGLKIRSASLDEIANRLEYKGCIKEAYQLDLIANEIDKNQKLSEAVDFLGKNNIPCELVSNAGPRGLGEAILVRGKNGAHYVYWVEPYGYVIRDSMNRAVSKCKKLKELPRVLSTYIVR